MTGSESGGTTPEERRIDERQTIELKVEYKRLNAFFADYTRNISKGGTFIQTDKPLDIGTEFVFKLYVPQLEDPLRIRGLVKWTVRPEEILTGGLATPGMGIRFIYRDDGEREQLERLVEQLMVGSLGKRLYSKLIASGERGEEGGGKQG
jgi:type IV pilus assembly protein PilZ